MGSTICVKCGSHLIPHSYCDVCHDVLCFRCSSCFMNTDERIHIYCQNINNVDNNNRIYSHGEQKLTGNPKSPQLIMNTHYYMQKQFNDEIKDSSIKLSTSYWDNVFESMKLVIRYWTKILNIGINNSSIIYQRHNHYKLIRHGYINQLADIL
jgi:hypothetical protein